MIWGILSPKKRLDLKAQMWIVVIVELIDVHYSASFHYFQASSSQNFKREYDISSLPFLDLFIRF